MAANRGLRGLSLGLFLVACTLMRVVYGKARKGGQVVDNPFVNPQPMPPPYHIPNMEGLQPWNRFEIPEFPSRFTTDFVYNRKYRGKWTYDYVLRKTKLDYYMGGKWVKGYFFNFQILKESVKTYEFGGSEGERCTQMDLVGGYHRMFSPRSWRRINLDDTELETDSGWEADRDSSVFSYSGNWNESRFVVHTFTNGTFTKIAVNNDYWHFFNFRDYSELDNYAAAHNADLKLLRSPLITCEYAGQLNPMYAARLQPKVPWPLVKPLQPKLPKASKKGGKRKGKGRNKRRKGRQRFRQIYRRSPVPLN